MVGFGMFLLFDRVTFHSRIINRIAQSAFSVYLITDYAASEKLLWVRLFNLQNLYQQPWAILLILGILLAIYAICTLLDSSAKHCSPSPSTGGVDTGSSCCGIGFSKLKRSQLNPPLDDSTNTR